jgi:peptidoglycan/LPS O-acetylase OafA/YrhL
MYNLQALRGVACLLVVILHLWILEAEFGIQTPLLREIRWFGVAGVDIFFVLSGFIITATNRQSLGRPAQAPGYLFRRFWRIYPTYWAVMGVSCLYLWIAYGNRGLHPEIFDNWLWWAALVPVAESNALVGQAWTLSYEVLFYLIFGVLMLCPPRMTPVVFFVWAVLVLFCSKSLNTPISKVVLSPFVLEFLGGCVVAWLSGRGIRCWWRPALLLGVVYMAAAVVMARSSLSESLVNALSPEQLRVLIFGPAAILIVYGLVGAEGKWPKRIPRWLLRTGDASYSLYLLHPTVLALGKWVGVLVPHSRLPHTLWLVGTLMAVLATGYLFHIWVECPLLRLGKSRRKPLRSVSPPEPVLPRKMAA